MSTQTVSQKFKQFENKRKSFIRSSIELPNIHDILTYNTEERMLRDVAITPMTAMSSVKLYIEQKSDDYRYIVCPSLKDLKMLKNLFKSLNDDESANIVTNIFNGLATHHEMEYDEAVDYIANATNMLVAALSKHLQYIQFDCDGVTISPIQWFVKSLRSSDEGDRKDRYETSRDNCLTSITGFIQALGRKRKVNNTPVPGLPKSVYQFHHADKVIGTFKPCVVTGDKLVYTLSSDCVRKYSTYERRADLEAAVSDVIFGFAKEHFVEDEDESPSAEPHPSDVLKSAIKKAQTVRNKYKTVDALSPLDVNAMSVRPVTMMSLGSQHHNVSTTNVVFACTAAPRLVKMITRMSYFDTEKKIGPTLQGRDEPVPKTYFQTTVAQFAKANVEFERVKDKSEDAPSYLAKFISVFTENVSSDMSDCTIENMVLLEQLTALYEDYKKVKNLSKNGLYTINGDTLRTMVKLASELLGGQTDFSVKPSKNKMKARMHEGLSAYIRNRMNAVQACPLSMSDHERELYSLLDNEDVDRIREIYVPVLLEVGVDTFNQVALSQSTKPDAVKTLLEKLEARTRKLETVTKKLSDTKPKQKKTKVEKPPKEEEIKEDLPPQEDPEDESTSSDEQDDSKEEETDSLNDEDMENMLNVDIDL